MVVVTQENIMWSCEIIIKIQDLINQSSLERLAVFRDQLLWACAVDFGVLGRYTCISIGGGQAEGTLEYTLKLSF